MARSRIDVSGALSGSLLQADPVVRGVLALLLLGSIASWAIIIGKLLDLARLRREVKGVETSALDPASSTPDRSKLLHMMLAARDAERNEPGENVRARSVAAMRGAALADLRTREGGLSFLATLASTAPFIGLFGTVWGIMRSFSAVAASNDTSLAVMAPGIAEALFATAMGLVAAIPAVIAYNLVRAALRRCGHRLAAAASLLATAPGPGTR